ncbi:MAG: helix-hairpin-helix domain-containing protein [Selenomonadaceae bacterium]|nr:helix-hairpin-helix domain-containing protein [Selenomonadaceae bacterium]
MPMYRKSLLILVLLVLVVTGGAMYGYYGEDGSIELAAAERPSEATDASNASHAKIVVYVVGAVNRPGVVTLDANARAADAVNACGGVLPTADVEHVNMAQMLKDGQQLRVPEKAGTDAAQGETQGKGAAEKGKSADGKININTADEKALDELPGVGPAMAKRIIEYRQSEGMFQSPEDLKKVRGIGEAKFEKMKDKITI